MDYLDIAKRLQAANKENKAKKTSETVKLPFEDVRNKAKKVSIETAVQESVTLPAEQKKVDGEITESQSALSGVTLPTKPDTLPRLPWQLERLLSAASSGVLTAGLPGVPDVPDYTLSLGCSYLVGDRDEATRRLWQVYEAWQGRLN